jgi:hypothetical protein
MLPSLLPHDLPTKTICISGSVAMSVWMYGVLYRRLIRRKHTRDFCKMSAWLNFLIQINNGVLAYAEHAPFLVGWYVIQTFATAIVLYLVYRYWDNPQS